MTHRLAALAAALLAGACARPDEPPREPQAQVVVTGWRWDFSTAAPGFCAGQGYVRNGGTAILADVRLAISFHDASNMVVATGRVPAEKARILPGEQSRFAFELPCPPGSESAELQATHGIDAPLIVAMRD